MAEEQRCQEGHRLCANNCGFFGSPATLNLCSKCYRDRRLKEEQQQQAASAAAKVAVKKSFPASSTSSSSSSAAVVAEEVKAPLVLSASPTAAAEIADSEAEKEKQKEKKAEAGEGSSRCARCRKRVGLTGFRCRCGATYCGSHRHAEQHGCTFDFKAVGRAAIARANPVVKADKLRKI